MDSNYISCAAFEKVSFLQFAGDMKDNFDLSEVEEGLDEMYNNIALPTRSTKGAAGYDFKSPFGFDLDPGASIKIPSGIRAKIKPGWWLMCVPRSSLGFKHYGQLANTVGVIDMDYYSSDNEGHIFFKLVNRGDRVISVRAGDGLIQGIFVPFGLIEGDNTETERNGGFGSTGR